MQIILCYEARASSDSDYNYIKSCIDYLYPNAFRKYKMTKFPLSTKAAYKSRKVKKEIDGFCSFYNGNNPGETTYVIYCLDADIDKTGSAAINPDIVSYCKQNGYQLVWFNSDVEDVFLGHTVDDKTKVRESVNFVKQNKIEKVNQVSLCCSTPLTRRHFSNLKLVFDQILGNL